MNIENHPSKSTDILFLPTDKIDVFPLPLELSARLHQLANEQNIPFLCYFIAGIRFLLYRYKWDNFSEPCHLLSSLDIQHQSQHKRFDIVFQSPFAGGHALSYIPSVTFEELKNIIPDISTLRTNKKINISLFEKSASDNPDFKVEINIQSLLQVEVNCISKPNSSLSELSRNIGHHLIQVLEGFLDYSSVPLDSFNYLTLYDIRVIKRNSVGKQSPELLSPFLLHQIFEQTAASFPDQSALLLADKSSVSYSSLNTRANQIAHTLRKSGVGKGDFVGLFMHKSSDLYAAMLGILKSGAAYVPIDPSFPKDRVVFILADCKAKATLSSSDFRNTLSELPFEAIFLDQIAFSDSLSSNISVEETSLSPEDTAYVIYTSGSTGMPKGVVIPHQSICNLVRIEGELFNVESSDRIFQGFSVAFDASLEEIWLAFHKGATLVIPTKQMMQAADTLDEYLREQGVTILSTVPTLLSMMKNDIPSLRLLILGGEVCSKELLMNWQASWRRIVNTYGPTEATVIATYSDFDPQKNLTIGKPIPNYLVFVLDKLAQLVPAGAEGEICIGGPVLATGYLHNDMLNSQKFVQQRVLNSNNERLYRTGDKGRYNEEGELEFIGRIDTQVKLRGFRIELAEIENQILYFPDIRNAVVTVKQGPDKMDKLIAYLLTENDSTVNEDALVLFLRTKLTTYMIPSFFVKLDKFPLMPSGKVDRHALPYPEKVDKIHERNIIGPSTETEQAIYGIWQKHFAPMPVSVTDDFFELGGHSLLASIVVSDLRNIPSMQTLSVKDIYSYPTIRSMAPYVDAIKRERVARKKEYAAKVSKVTYRAVTLLQYTFIGLFYLAAAKSILSLQSFMRSYSEVSAFGILFIMFCVPVAYITLATLLSVVGKWAIIGRFKKGNYPLWGWYFLRFWVVKRLVDMVPLSLFAGTPILNLYCRAMGAKIGKGVYMGSERIRAFDLLTVGDHSSINKEAYLMGYRVERETLIIGSITLGEQCWVGVRSMLNEQCKMEQGSSLKELSLLSAYTTIPKVETWEGSPAQIAKIQYTNNPIKVQSKNISYVPLQFIALLIVIFLPVLAMLPVLAAGYYLVANYGHLYSFFALLPLCLLYIMCYATLVYLVHKVTKDASPSSIFSVKSNHYVRKWLGDQVMLQTLSGLKGVYATLYLPPFLRLLGAKIGKGSEVSTVNQITPDLLRIGANSFLADSVSIGAPLVKDGYMSVLPTKIGEKTFIGNGAVLPSGAIIGDNVLIGVSSTQPYLEFPERENNSSWLGSPPIYLPKRDIVEGFPESLTYAPSARLIRYRLFVEFFKIVLPYYFSACITFSLYLCIVSNEKILQQDSILPLLAILLSLLMCGIATAVVTLVFKWLLMGKLKPGQKPLWDVFVWKNELVNSLCESMVYPALVNPFLGTPLASLFFKAMGCKFGERTFMETTEITEFDLVQVGDDVALNYGSTIQTHLFEDRIMKMDFLYIGNNCSVGPASVVLYSSNMKTGSSLNSLSLLMKGEILKENTSWEGLPAKFQ